MSEEGAVLEERALDGGEALFDENAVAAQKQRKVGRELEVVMDAKLRAGEDELLASNQAPAAVRALAVGVLEQDGEPARVIVTAPRQVRVALEPQVRHAVRDVPFDDGPARRAEVPDLNVRRKDDLVLEGAEREPNFASSEDVCLAVLLDKQLEPLNVDEVERLGRLLVVAEDDNEGEWDDVDPPEIGRDGGRRALGSEVDVGAREPELNHTAQLREARIIGTGLAVTCGVAVSVQAKLAEDLRRREGKRRLVSK